MVGIEEPFTLILLLPEYVQSVTYQDYITTKWDWYTALTCPLRRWQKATQNAGLPTLTVSPWVSRFQGKCHSLTAAQVIVYCWRGLHVHETKPCIHKLCKQHQAIIATRQPSVIVFEQAKLAGLWKSPPPLPPRLVCVNSKLRESVAIVHSTW